MGEPQQLTLLRFAHVSRRIPWGKTRGTHTMRYATRQPLHVRDRRRPIRPSKPYLPPHRQTGPDRTGKLPHAALTSTTVGRLATRLLFQ